MALNFPPNPSAGTRYQNWVFDGVKWVVQASTLAEAPNTPIGYARDGATGVWVPESPNNNKFINPFMEIDQANEGTGIGTSNLYVVDGFRVWLSSTGGGTFTSNRATNLPPPGYTFNVGYSIATAATSIGANDSSQIFQYLEASELQDTFWGTVNAQPLTLTFWAFCTVPGTYFVSIRNNPAATPTRSYIIPFTLNTASTWQLFTFTIPGDITGSWTLSGNSAALGVTWVLGCGSNLQNTVNTWLSANALAGSGMVNTFMQTASATFRLGPCKLEVGTKATPILRTSFQQELARCQRYYYKSFAVGTPLGTATFSGAISNIAANSGNGDFLGTNFGQVMRTTPSISLYNPQTGAAGTIRDNTTPNDVGGVVPTQINDRRLGALGFGPTDTHLYLYHYTADARL